MALPLNITGISVAVASVGPFQVSPAISISYYVNVSNTVLGTSASTHVAQVFTVGASNITVPEVRWVLGKTGTPTDNLTTEIRTVSGGVPTTTVVATSAVVAASSFTLGEVAFSFSAPPVLSASTQYAIVIYRTGAVSAIDNYVVQNSGGSDTYAGGGGFTSANGTSFSSVTSDHAFKVLSTEPAYYFFGRDGTTATTLQAYKSTAPDTSWSSIATKTGFTTAILNLAACQSGSVTHILVQDGTASTSLATKYVSFDASSDSFLVTTETVSAAVAVTGQIAGAGAGASLVVRSDGSVVAFYSGVQTKTSGTFRARVYYRIRTALNTYGTETEVDANTAVDNNQPLAVLGVSDRVHFLFFNQTNTHQRHLTSANVLGTAASTGATTAMQDVCRMVDSGTIRHVGFTAAQACRWSSADNPTVTAASITTGTPVRTVDNNLIIYALYQNSADSDIYIKGSSDNGATFGSATNVFTGTVASAAANLSKNQTAYQRGSSVVFPYVVNDNGTLKYNEYIVGAAFSPARVDLALSSTAPTASVLAGFPNISPAQANLALSPTQAAVGFVKDLNTVDLVLSTTAPTFSTLLDIPISPARVDLALSPTAPTAAQGLFANPPRVDLALSATAPTASVIGAGLNISPPRVDLAISGSQAAVGTVKVLDADDLVLSPTAPTASVGGGAVGIIPPRVDLALSTTVPTSIRAIAADPVRRDLLLSLTVPTAVLAIPRDIPQVNLAITTTAPQPVVLSGLVISPATVNLALTPTQPAIGAVKDLNAGALSISPTAPTVSIPAGSVSRSPPAVNLTLSSLAPDAGLASDIPVAQLVISTTAPTRSVVVAGTISMSPARVDLAISGSQPAVGIVKDIASDDLLLSYSIPTVTVSAANNTTITPDTRDLAISCTAPTALVTVHASVAPSTRDLVLSTTVPSVELAVTSCIILPPSVNLLLSTTAASSIRTTPPRPQFVRYVRPMTHIMRRW